MQDKSGVLYIVATPIGNLGDISRRALTILAAVSRIYAEDTRHSQHMLAAYGIKARLVSLYDHNESGRLQEVIDFLLSGENAALISDAGTPLICDPGYKLVEACHSAAITVSPIPGPSALIGALSVAGLPTDKFLFLGFPPAKAQARRGWLERYSKQSETMVFYESRHRIADCLSDMASVFGVDRKATLARELTKRFETVKRSSLSGLGEWLAENPRQHKGEFVLVVSGADDEQVGDSKAEEVITLLLRELSVKRSAELAATILNKKKNQMYRLALQISDRSSGV